jgi:hypothetical protein
MSGTSAESESLAERIAIQVIEELDWFDVEAFVDRLSDGDLTFSQLNDMTNRVMDALKRIKIDFKES